MSHLSILTSRAPSMFSKFHEPKANLSLGCWTLPISHGLVWPPRFWTSPALLYPNLFCSNQCPAMGPKPTCYSSQLGPSIWISAPILSLGHCDPIVMFSEESFITCVTSNRLENADITNQVTSYNLRSTLQIWLKKLAGLWGPNGCFLPGPLALPGSRCPSRNIITLSYSCAT